MESLIHLYNTALGELGGEQLPMNISPIEGDTVGMLCQNLFPHILESALESHDWSFATARGDLALLPQPDDEGETGAEYAFAYALPADCVKPIRLAGAEGGARFVIEGDRLLCDRAPARLVYVARVTNPKRWPAYFADVLVWKLASALASARNNDKQQKQQCERMYEFSLAKACAKDSAAKRFVRGRSLWQKARQSRVRR